MIARQRSAWSAFAYDVYGEGGQPLAEILWPTVFQARNARLR